MSRNTTSNRASRVTVEWLDERIAEVRELAQTGDTAQERMFYTGKMLAFDAVRDLLTAQPSAAPGTSDGAAKGAFCSPDMSEPL